MFGNKSSCNIIFHRIKQGLLLNSLAKNPVLNTDLKQNIASAHWTGKDTTFTIKRHLHLVHGQIHSRHKAADASWRSELVPSKTQHCISSLNTGSAYSNSHIVFFFSWWHGSSHSFSTKLTRFCFEQSCPSAMMDSSSCQRAMSNYLQKCSLFFWAPYWIIR